jgi:hypothetical protein
MFSIKEPTISKSNFNVNKLVLKGDQNNLVSKTILARKQHQDSQEISPEEDLSLDTLFEIY